MKPDQPYLAQLSSPFANTQERKDFCEKCLGEKVIGDLSFRFDFSRIDLVVILTLLVSPCKSELFTNISDCGYSNADLTYWES